MHGRNAHKLHPNHIAFLKELAIEADAIAKGRLTGHTCHSFVEDTFHDVLDAVCNQLCIRVRTPTN